MYRIALSDEQHDELRARTRQRGLASSTRDRLEMGRPSDAGWSVPRSARHLGQHEQTVRAWIKAFLAGGFDALPHKPRGGKQSALGAAMLESVRTEVARGGRPWTAAQRADWVAEHHGVRLSADRLRRARISGQRTSRTLRHTQDPDEVAARHAVRDDLATRGRLAGSICATVMKPALP